MLPIPLAVMDSQQSHQRRQVSQWVKETDLVQQILLKFVLFMAVQVKKLYLYKNQDLDRCIITHVPILLKVKIENSSK
jgi:hypothetical protein